MANEASAEPGKIISLPSGAVCFGPFRFDPTNVTLSRGDAHVHLPPRALGVLEYFVRRPGLLVSKEELLEAVWADIHVTEDALTQAISLIRQALGDDPRDPSYIETVPRLGYRFVGEVSAAPRPQAEEPASSIAPEDVPVRAGPMAAQKPLWQRALPWGAGVAVGAIVASLSAWSLLRPAAPELTHSVIPLERGLHLWGGHNGEANLGLDRPSRRSFALTPDGRAIVYAATDGSRSQLYLHRLDGRRAVPIAGTEGGSSPFLSPDGRQVGFIVGSDILVVPINGGKPRTVLADATFKEGKPFGVSWFDDTIVFAGEKEIFGVPAAGGSPEQLSTLSIEPVDAYHAHPQFLPGGATLLYRARREGGPSEIVALPPGGEPIVLVSDGVDPMYSPTGHLIFARRGVLMAVAFDPERLEVMSDPVPIIEDVMQAVRTSNSAIGTAAAQFSFSTSGSLVYATGGTHPEARTRPMWIGRDGTPKPIPVPATTTLVWFPRISPEGRRVTYGGPSRFDLDVIVVDLATRATWRLDLPGSQVSPVWSPDGTRLAFSSNHDGGVDNLYWIADDLSGDPRRVTEGGGDQWLSDWSADDVLSFVENDDIWVVDVTGESKPKMFVGDPWREWWPTFSPDGDWLAYASDESGRWEVYVRPYPERDPVYQVTQEGGRSPAWSRDGSELFFRGVFDSDNRSKMMAVQVDRSAMFRSEPPRELFDRVMAGTTPARSYDVAADGRFFMIENWIYPPQPVTELNLVLNWFEELKRLVPVEQ